MFYKINKILLKISSPFKLILLKILFFSILFFYSETAFSKVTNIERNLAYKYCDSLEKNLFNGLENERILKYKYLFSSINVEEINEEIKSLDNFGLEVDTICSYKLSNEEIENIKKELKIFLSNSL
tara:strand:+ start:260 stop:637 length:378 start_codon:yes stop_codon:yes gene_type:complete